MIADFFSSLAGGAGSGMRDVRNAILENPAMSLADPKTWEDILDGPSSEAGIRMNHRKALRLPPVWQAVSLISGDLASMTLNKWQRLPDGDSQIDPDHDAQVLVAIQANEETHSFEYWRRLMVHALMWENGYAWIDRLGSRKTGKPVGMVNLLPDRTRPARTENGDLFYITEVNGQPQPLFKEEVIHVKGLSLDNSLGADLLAMARNSWGLALAAEGFASRFFANGAQAGGVLEIPPHWTEKAAKVLEEGVRRKMTGKDNWFKTMVLRDGAKFHQIMVDAQKSQMHELREDQVLDVARFFNLPPIKLNVLHGMAYNTPEQMQIAYLTGCLNHWRLAVASEAGMKLLTDAERKSGRHWFEHDLSRLLEIDSKTLNEVMEIQRRNEVINANEWRRKIGLPRRADPGGETYVNPNTKSKDTTPPPTPPAPPEKPKKPKKALAAPLAAAAFLPAPAATPSPAAVGDAGERPSNRVEESLRQLFADAVNRVARRVSFDAKNAAKKPAKFLAWLDSKAADHRPVFDEVLRPVLMTIGAVQGKSAPDMEALLCSLGGRFFAALIERVAIYVEPPYVQAQLVENVSWACDCFEVGVPAVGKPGRPAIAELLAALVFPSPNGDGVNDLSS